MDRLDGLAALRAPFDPSVIGKLPRKVKDGNGGWRTIKLDFVGHALVTDRLLSVDPEWSWEFGCLDPTSGHPSKEASIERDDQGRPVALWMALTACGVTRRDIGYVDPEAKDEPMKLLVSDALCRAAMRFGVGLDLWAKDGLESHQPLTLRHVDVETGEITTPAPAPAPKRSTRRRPAPAQPTSTTAALMARVNALAERQACRAALSQVGPLGEHLAEAEAIVARFEVTDPFAGMVTAGNGNGNGHGA